MPSATGLSTRAAAGCGRARLRRRRRPEPPKRGGAVGHPSTRAERVEVAVPSLAGRRRRARLLVRRLSHLPASEVTRHDRIPVTTPARTVLDLAAVLARPELERVVDESERLGLFALRAVEAVLARSSGRPGARSLAEVLAHSREPQ